MNQVELPFSFENRLSPPERRPMAFAECWMDQVPFDGTDSFRFRDVGRDWSGENQASRPSQAHNSQFGESWLPFSKQGFA